MNQKGKFRLGFIEELQAQILEMKYTMGKLSMLVLLPSCSEDNVKSLQEVHFIDTPIPIPDHWGVALASII